MEKFNEEKTENLFDIGLNNEFRYYQNHSKDTLHIIYIINLTIQF